MTGKSFIFQDIYDDYQPKIHRYMGRLVDPSEADDLTQEVFIKVDRGLSGFRGEAKLSTWIYKIATNVAMDRVRSSSFKKEKANVPVTEEGVTGQDRDLLTGEKKPSIERQLIRSEMGECVREFIDDLPENYRAVIALSEVSGMKNREIAEILGISLESVKINLHRGRLKLKEKLATGCDFDRDEENVLACDRKSPPDSSE